MKDDPIFSAIERHRTASNAWFEADCAADRLEERRPKEAPPVSRAYADAMANIEREAFKRLFLTTPTTLDGCLAFLHYIQEGEGQGEEFLQFVTVPGYRIAGLALVARLSESISRLIERNSG